MAKNNYKNGSKGSGKDRKQYPGKYKDMKTRGERKSVETRKQCPVDTEVTNNINWYNKYPDDLKTAASFPWFKIIGRPIDLDDGGNTTSFKPAQIMGIKYYPTIGYCDKSTDPVNKCFAIIMADLLAKTTSGDLGFQQMDLAMEQIGIASIIASMGKLRRALEATDFWTSKNITYPKALLSAMGYDWQSIVNERKNYIVMYNTLAHQINSMQLPKFLDIPERWYALNHNVYVDEDSEYGQIYFFDPAIIYSYEDTANPAKLKPVEFPSRTGTSANAAWFADFSTVQAAVNKWYNSSDFYLINGALLRTYKDNEIWSISDISLDDSINPTADRIILSQIMNMDISSVILDTLAITQDPLTNSLICKAEASTTNVTTRKLLRYFGDDTEISLDDNVEMTRLCHHCVDGGGTGKYVKGAQSEIVSNITLYNISDTDYGKANKLGDLGTSIIPVATSATALPVLKTALYLQTFRFIPTMYFITDYASDKEQAFLMGDLYNYTTIQNSTLDNLTEICKYSLWKPNRANFQ